MKKTLFVDCEVYSNFFLLVFKCLETGQIKRLQQSPNTKLDCELLARIMRSHRTIGFNSKNFDVPIIQLALKGASTQELKVATNEIIIGEMRPRDFAEKYDLMRVNWDHVDLLEVCPGVMTSLKLYCGRLHCKKLQDLPYDPEIEVNAEQASKLFEYCCIDLNNTEILFQELEGQIKLREELGAKYNLDVRSLSDAQIAEKVTSAEIKRLTGSWPGRPQNLLGTSFHYNVPSYVSFRTPQLKAMLEKVRSAKFVVGDNGAVKMPHELDGLQIKLGGGTYRMGIGGLHSSETSVYYVADDNFLLIDRDVISFYPKIILTLKLFPKHIGEIFLSVYQAFVDMRIAAKKAGDKKTAESLKIAINGLYGKLGSMWSAFYSPESMIHVTLTGQLVLLMLIEMMEAMSIPVISANTDGILMRCPKTLYPALESIVQKWEALTGFETEEGRYKAVLSKDVNNYIAIKDDGKVKGKGLYSCPWNGVTEGPPVFKLSKNPSTTIVIEAVIALLRDNTPLEQTIRGCHDITKFVSVRSVTGGANSQGSYLGKVIRWFYSTDTRQSILNYVKSGNKVPKSDGSKPLMELPDEFPADINYAWYVEEAKSVLNSIGYGQRTLF